MLLWFWALRQELNRVPWQPGPPSCGYISDILHGVPISASISRMSNGQTLVSAPVGLFTDIDLGKLAEAADKAGETLTFGYKASTKER